MQKTIKLIAKVYIDGSNIFYTQKQMGWTIDWVKTKKYLKRTSKILEFRYYTGLKVGDKKMKRYLNYLDSIGFVVLTKPLKRIRLKNTRNSSKDSRNQFIYKANFDVEIAVDILLDRSKINEIILFSGDSDFSYLVKNIRKLGKTATIFSSRKTLSWELKLQASQVRYLDDLEGKFKRE